MNLEDEQMLSKFENLSQLIGDKVDYMSANLTFQNLKKVLPPFLEVLTTILGEEDAQLLEIKHILSDPYNQALIYEHMSIRLNNING